MCRQSVRAISVQADKGEKRFFMKVLVLTVGDAETASTKYRIVQHEGFLRDQGVHLEYVRRENIDMNTVALASRVDAVLNQKCLFNVLLADRIISACKHTVFDYDDAIYTRPGKPHSWLTRLRVRQRLNIWLKRSNVVMPANQYLAEYARNRSEHVQVVPMSLDLTKWRPVSKPVSKTVVLGWAGAPVNIVNIERIETVLSRIVKSFPNVRVAVLSGKKPKLNIPFDYHPFSPGLEHGFVQSLDIGLLPLPDEEYSRGKSPIKAIQYLSCGVPIVGNIFGATREICNSENSISVQTERDWIDALAGLINNRSMITRLGMAGRRWVEQNFDSVKTGQLLLNCLCPNIT